MSTIPPRAGSASSPDPFDAPARQPGCAAPATSPDAAPTERIECLGRADLQVKVRGYRIELKEIEAALGRPRSVRAGIVEPRRDANGDVRLIAHVVARAGNQISASESATS